MGSRQLEPSQLAVNKHYSSVLRFTQHMAKVIRPGEVKISNILVHKQQTFSSTSGTRYPHVKNVYEVQREQIRTIPSKQRGKPPPTGANNPYEKHTLCIVYIC